MRDLDAADVAARLAKLAAMYVPETVAQGRARLRDEAMAPDSIVTTVQARLDELRALDDLGRYLRRKSS